MRSPNLASIALLGLAFAGCASAPAASPGTPASTPAVVLRVTASDMEFDPRSLSVPADSVFAIEFDNRDVVPHNVSIRAGGPGFAGEIFGGPASRTSTFAGLPAGSYQFICDVHPEMTGLLTSVVAQ